MLKHGNRKPIYSGMRSADQLYAGITNNVCSTIAFGSLAAANSVVFIAAATGAGANTHLVH